MRKLGLAIAALALAGFMSGPAWAEPATKHGVAAADGKIVPATSTVDAWTDILTATFKTGGAKDMTVDFTAECVLITDNNAEKGNAKKDRSTASLRVRVLVDGVEAIPGPVTLCQRVVELEFDGDGFLSADTIDLLINTLSTHGFNFVALDVGQGLHTVKVQGQVFLADLRGGPSAAFLLKRSMIAEEVNLKGTGDFSIVAPQCSDGIDNDNDGTLDHSSINAANPDTDCSSIADNDESS